jgi:Papain family cysteine protease
MQAQSVREQSICGGRPKKAHDSQRLVLAGDSVPGHRPHGLMLGPDGRTVQQSIGRAAALVLLAALAACTGGDRPAPSAVFADDNVYGPTAPAGATQLTPDEFEAKVNDGTLTLDTAKDRASLQVKQDGREAQDRALLAGLPDKSQALIAMLAPKTGLKSAPGGEYLVDVPLPDGSTKTIVTLGDAQDVRMFVSAYQGSSDHDTLVTVYGQAFQALDPSQQGNLPSPAALAGKATGEVQAALAALDATLSSLSGLDLVQPAPAILRVAPQVIVVHDGGANAGNGSDSSGDCAALSLNGLRGRLNWPLKSFLTPVKNQASRGTCWAFAAIGYLEARERVVRDVSVNLSEQYFVNVEKRDAIADIDFFGEGDLTFTALDKFAVRHLAVAPEDAWTYNPSYGRALNPDGSFNGGNGVCLRDRNPDVPYTGPCSESIHQSPTSCTSLRSSIFCGYERVDYVGASTVGADSAWPFWANLAGLELPVGVVRGLLASGQPVIASLDVHPGFGNPNAGTADRGYVTDFTDHSRGGHIVLIVGFVPDASATFAPAVAGGTGGGFFVIRNSWGCDYGDGGYAYVPVSYARRFFTSLTATSMTSERSAAWMTNLNALRGPHPSGANIAAPADNTTVNAVSGPGPDYFATIGLSGNANNSDGSGIPGSQLRWSFVNTADSVRHEIGVGAVQTVNLVNGAFGTTRHFVITMEVLDASAGLPIPTLTRTARVNVAGPPN